MIRIHVSYVGHALLFDEIAKSGQHFHQARDAPGEQALQLFASRRTRLPEDRFALSVLIDAVEHETMMTWRGLGLDAALLPIAAMLAFSAAFTAIAIWRFEWEE